jgi:ABC-type tungstate transport system substrate-binding protein/ABC-type multidrug transport system ATPase subunit
MQNFGAAFGEAFGLLLRFDPALMEIIGLSLRVSLTAVLISGLIGLPLGAILGVSRFRGRAAILVLLNTLMGLPPVVVGLLVYLSLSNAGPLGPLALLYTPAAMIIAQSLLVIPIVAALARQTIEDMHGEYDELLRVLGVGRWGMVATLLWDARYSLLTAMLAGFGRAVAEVGAVLIVGGNINHVTRVMTTAIALETSKGNLALALGLGVVHTPSTGRNGRHVLPIMGRGLLLERGGRRIIDNMDFTIEGEGLSVVMGPNGAGKSVLLRLLTGLLKPDAGTVSWAGARPDRAGAPSVGMVFQKPVLLRRSALANVRYVLRAGTRAERTRMAEEALAWAGLLHLARTPARLLSGGQQQRLAIARALAPDPEVLLLDEPCANLDPAATAAIEALIGDARARGTKVVLVTHDVAQAKRVADDITFIHDGRIDEQAPAAAFFEDPQSPASRAYLDGRLLV